MNEKLGQESVFPNDGNWANGNPEQGINKRFYAACAAMQGILASESIINNLPIVKGDEPQLSNLVVRLSYNMADELLKQELL